MTGKTHMAVGTAATLALVQPTGIRGIVVTTAAAIIGSVISDIDVSTSESHRDVNKIIVITAFVLAAVAILDNYMNIGIVGYIHRNSGLARIITGLLAFLGMCIFGQTQPHRSFMHSAIAVVIFYLIVYVMMPMAALPFAVAMSSHIVADMFNYKKVKIFYPMKKGISFKMCKANGIVNKMLFYVGMIITVLLIAKDAWYLIRR